MPPLDIIDRHIASIELGLQKLREVKSTGRDLNDYVGELDEADMHVWKVLEHVGQILSN